MQTTPGPCIALCANQAWNLVNFRQGLIRALVARGFSVVAIAPADPVMEEKLARLGCRFVALPIDAMGIRPWRDLLTIWRLRAILGQLRPAAYLSWTIKPNVYGSLLAGRLGIAALPNVSGLGTAFIRRNLLTRVVKLLYRIGFARAQTVFFQNRNDLALFCGEGLVRKDQACLLPGSGIDAKAWAPSDDTRPARRHFLMLARVVADKGVREFVAAAAILKAEFSDARFTLMGPLDVANRTAITRSEVAKWVDAGTIRYCPPCEDVRPAMAEADFVVLPSYREGMSRVLLEAAAMGRVLVGSDVPGCRELVRDGENGFICQPRDAASLAGAMARAARIDDAAWQAMSRAGQAMVRAEFAEERVHELYFEALEKAGVLRD